MMNAVPAILLSGIRHLTCLLLALLSTGAHADSPLNLYLGLVPVEQQSAGLQQQAIKQALLQVLEKTSGKRFISDYPGVSEALDSAQSLAVSFYYQPRNSLQPDGSTIERLHLAAQFDPSAVDRLRQELSLPRWSSQRRPLSIWILVDDGQGRRVQPIELEYAWQEVRFAAMDRGMPLDWPVTDENGEYTVDLQLLWGGFVEELAEGEAIDMLVMAALREGPEWSMRLNLAYGELRWTQRLRGADIQQLAAQSMHEAIDQIAEFEAILPDAVGTWLQPIRVSGLLAADDYARILSYLQGLGVVERVGVRGARAGEVDFELELNAAPEYLWRFLQSGQLLQATDTEGHFILTP